MLSAHAEETRDVTASAQEVFAYIDRPERLSAYMGRRSWHLLGSTMTIETDEYHGQKVGSRVRLRGRVLGIPLAVDAIIVARDPPYRKAWETSGDPHLLVMGAYRMRVTIAERGEEARVGIGIDYAPPPRGPERLLGRLFGAAYARWCVGEMATDLQRAFA
jgi:polyketide cyclase/dehydrase/lipid transport protein